MLYQIHRYPADLIDVVHLDGRRVVVRPVLPQDEQLTVAFFGGLPSGARYDRFMSPMRNLPPELVKRFTNIDYAQHLALVAEIFEEGRETVIAEARYAIRDGVEAEFAVSVDPAWQGKGLASQLLSKLLCRAAQAGLQRVVGETLATNAAMQHLARKAGFTVQRSADVSGVLLLQKDLSLAPDADCGSQPLPAHAA
jgi:acetyltransferase